MIGHRGAAAIAPENTLASLAAAVEAGADLVEFDVGAGLTLAHSPSEVPDDPISLDQALDFLRPHDVGIHVDVKHVGIEPQIVDALRRHGLTERAVVSAALARSVRRVAAAAPDLPRAIGYPRDRFGVSVVPVALDGDSRLRGLAARRDAAAGAVAAPALARHCALAPVQARLARGRVGRPCARGAGARVDGQQPRGRPAARGLWRRRDRDG